MLTGRHQSVNYVFVHHKGKRTSWSHSEKQKQKTKTKPNKGRQLLVASLIDYYIDFTIWFRVGLFVGNTFFFVFLSFRVRLFVCLCLLLSLFVRLLVLMSFSQFSRLLSCFKVCLFVLFCFVFISFSILLLGCLCLLVTFNYFCSFFHWCLCFKHC